MCYTFRDEFKISKFAPVVLTKKYVVFFKVNKNFKKKLKNPLKKYVVVAPKSLELERVGHVAYLCQSEAIHLTS